MFDLLANVASALVSTRDPAGVAIHDLKMIRGRCERERERCGRPPRSPVVDGPSEEAVEKPAGGGERKGP